MPHKINKLTGLMKESRRPYRSIVSDNYIIKHLANFLQGILSAISAVTESCGKFAKERSFSFKGHWD